jgi:hypothetical protein
MEMLLERIIQRYGTGMVWKSADVERVIKGFFQPVTSRSWQKMKREMTPLGEVPIGLYVYIGTMSNELLPGDRLVLGKREYQVRRMEVIYDSQGGAYRWGLCAQKGG